MSDGRSRYARTLERLYALDVRRGWDLKLESVRAALSELGSPERGLEVLHVAGTNGKGSVAAFAHAVLVAAGRHAGLYTSPHLEDLCERIRPGAREIAPERLVDLVEEAEAAAARAAVELTFFELITIAALVAFGREPVRPAVVEVGLGGRLDATNVLSPRVGVITTIALDHERFLGSDLVSIAREKAGIVKPATPLVLGRIDGEPLGAILAIADEAGSPVRRLGRDFSIERGGPGGLVYAGERRVEGIRPGLEGAFQADNAAVALAALEAGGWLDGIDDDTVRRGLAGVRWPGRLERRGRVILDGAHNPAAARALAPEVRRIAAGRPVHLVFGVLADKRHAGIAAALLPVVDGVTLVPVRERRGARPERLREAFPGAAVADSAASAVDEALARAEAGDGMVLVAGSLFLVGEVRAHLAGTLR